MDRRTFLRITRALVDGRRFEILERIAAVKDEISCIDLRAVVPISRATLSEVKEALKLLCRRPLVILSNGTLTMLRAVVKNAGLGGMFTHVISVDEVKIYKPRAAAYQLAVRKLGVNRKDVAFVSSNF
jgi:2-haloacid dehalogenase